MSIDNQKQAANAWRVLFLLFLANLLNFFDRTIPAIVAEPLRLEWNLSDLQIGFMAAAFTLVYAIAGMPLGRLADTGARRKIMGWGLIVWSGFTALNGMAWNYLTFFLVRMGVGVGEASYAPAANSMIGDLFPAEKRARAMGIFMLGLPLGLMLAFFTVGPMIAAFESWRAPFFIAAVPGLLLAVFIFFIKEPARGAAEARQISAEPIQQPMRKVLRVRTLWWIILSGLTMNFAVYAANGFLVPMLQRYFHLPLGAAAVQTGIIVGITGLIGLTLGGWVTDKIYQRSRQGRLTFGAISLLIAAIATTAALSLGSDAVGLFTLLFALGWLFSYIYYTSVYPAIQDVVQPRLRATAVALYFSAMYLLGGAMGPVVVGGLSDRLSVDAMTAAGAQEMSEQFKAIGLHDAMFLVPVMLFLTAVFLFLAARSFNRDAAAMERDMA